MAQHQVAKVNDFHRRFAEWLILNPHKKLIDAAEEFGYSISHLSIIRNSDAFKDYYDKLSEQATRSVIGTIQEQAAVAVSASLGEINRQLEAAPESIPLAGHLAILDTLGKRFSPQPVAGGGAPQVINITVASQAELEEARRLMREGRSQNSLSPPREGDPGAQSSSGGPVLDLRAIAPQEDPDAP